MAKVFCFGNTSDGQLGLGGIEDEHILSPRKQRLPYDRRTFKLLQIASGRNHTLLLLRKIVHEKNIVFSCGSNERAQLGRNGSWRKLEAIDGLSSHNIVSIACGSNHSLALSEAGQIFAWGCNVFGQLGLGERETQESSKPLLLKKLASKCVVQIACGANHCLALTKYGELYSWGSNAFGQLGLGSQGNCVSVPSRIIALQWSPIRQIVGGGSHSAVLSNGGALYLWGKNEFGQLGQSDQTNRWFPTLQLSLKAQKIAYVSLGEEHSAAITEEGGLFTWGAGMYGQLGHGRNLNEVLPKKVFELMGSKITQVSCGRCHTLVATEFGRVISFGLNGSGQLGIGSRELKSSPTIIRGPWIEINRKELQPRSARSIVISPAFPMRKSMPCFSEQFDDPKFSNSPDMEVENVDTEEDLSEIEVINTPEAIVEEPDDYTRRQFMPSSPLPNFLCQKDTVYKRSFIEIDEYESEPDSDKEDNITDARQHCLFQVVASKGDQSFIMLQAYSPDNSPIDMRLSDPDREIAKLDNSIFESFKHVSKDSTPLELIDYIEEVLSSVPCWNASYVSTTLDLTDDKHVKRLIAFITSLDFSREDFHVIVRNRIDFEQAWVGFNAIEEAQNDRITELVYESIMKMFENVADTAYKDQFKKEMHLHEEVLRIYLILPFFHLFRIDEQNHALAQPLINKFSKAVSVLNKSSKNYLKVWWGSMKKAQMRNLIDIFKKSIQFNLAKQNEINHQEESEQKNEVVKLCANVHYNLAMSLDLCKMLFEVNKKTQVVSFKDFYIEGLHELFDLRKDYMMWKSQGCAARVQTEYYLCNFSFIFDAAAKHLVLAADSELEQSSAAHNSIYRQVLLSRPDAEGRILVNPYLVISVHRNTILQETINQLCVFSKHAPSDFKRPLQVFFEGEEAIDAGQGMKKEFFLLLMKEILDEKYGMFAEFKETSTIWFHHANDEDTVMYHLIGILCGLAIYNAVIINLPFPLVLYKKILGEKLELEDLSYLDPLLTKNLKDILNPSYSREEFEAIYGDMNFVVTLQTYGHPVEYELDHNGSSRSLTFENREEYVELYWKYLLETSIHKQFNAFQEGFMKVLDSNILQIFHAEELMQLVSGQDTIDWEELEASAQYKEPFKKDHSTIKLFWRVFHGFTEEEKKKFLLFLTGSDRIPILGVKALNIVIQPMRVSEDHLPVAHTCFNILDLPMHYECEQPEDKMRAKLLKACEFTKGFALA